MRRCFFIFDYENDLDEARRIAEMGLVQAESAAGFNDLTQWSTAKARGVEEVKRQIDEALVGTSCSVVLIGPRTASLGYVSYAMERSIQRHNGLLGIHIHALKNPMAAAGERGPLPYEREAAQQSESKGYAVHDWDPDQFVAWVNTAATDWRNYARPTPPRVFSTL
jgi:hypothetical protein